MKMPMTMMFTSQLFAYIQSRTPAQALGDVVGFEHRQGCEDEDRAVAGLTLLVRQGAAGANSVVASASRSRRR